jgi:hypothetical protein
MSRRTLPPERRRPFYAWIDELQRISGTGSGSAGESIARSLEEARKMGLRLQLMSQQPTRLAKPTLDAILTNRSHLLTHLVGADSARVIAKEWGGDVDPATITRLAKYWFLAQVTLDGEISRPFLARGFDIETEEPWVSRRRTGQVDALDRRIDTNLARRSVSEILDELDGLDERIVDHLEATARGRAGFGMPRPIDGDVTRAPARRRGSGHLVVLDGPDDDGELT